LIFVRELTASDVITHSAHPAGPQPRVSGRKHPSLHNPGEDATESISPPSVPSR
jgi:hypothetical protein